MEINLINKRNNAIISIEVTMTNELEKYIEKNEKEIEEKINSENESLSKSEQIEIDEF